VVPKRLDLHAKSNNRQAKDEGHVEDFAPHWPILMYGQNNFMCIVGLVFHTSGSFGSSDGTGNRFTSVDSVARWTITMIRVSETCPYSGHQQDGRTLNQGDRPRRIDDMIIVGGGHCRSSTASSEVGDGFDILSRGSQ
jgi:hypothetical protein